MSTDFDPALHIERNDDGGTSKPAGRQDSGTSKPAGRQDSGTSKPAGRLEEPGKDDQ